LIVVKALIIIAVVLFGVMLAVSNPGSTTLNYLAGEMEIPTAWLVVGSIAAGAVVGGALVGMGVLQWRYRARQWRRKAEAAEQELGNLRNLPCNGS
jgi:uncharacterized integral membrane protein